MFRYGAVHGLTIRITLVAFSNSGVGSCFIVRHLRRYTQRLMADKGTQFWFRAAIAKAVIGNMVEIYCQLERIRA